MCKLGVRELGHVSPACLLLSWITGCTWNHKSPVLSTLDKGFCLNRLFELSLLYFLKVSGLGLPSWSTG